jgi:MoaA/NifB/PqqE/SkfB family radical SAM enzyme
VANSKIKEKYIIEREPYTFAKPWHKQFPPMLVVSITNVCNLRCVHCYYSKFIKLPDYHPNMLPWNIWEKICMESSHWPGVVLNFGTDGEPLLHPRFLDMLRLARKYSISPINITTNGILMNNKFKEAVIKESLVDIMNISIDACTPETYKKIRGGNFNKLIRNVKNLIGHRDRTGSPLKIQVNFIDQPDSRPELEDFKKQWEKLVDNVMIRIYYDATSVTGETGANISGKQVEFEQVERWPCQQLWRRFNISDDGTVRFCVDDWFNKTKLGDLKTQSIAEIWTGEKYNRLRHLHIKGQYDKILYCSKCTEWQGMKWDYDYFTAMKKMLNKDLL